MTWRLPHHLPLSPSIAFLQAKPSFRSLCSQACSCFRVFEYTPTWDSICPNVLPPLMPPQLALSCSSVGLKCNLLSQTFPNHILFPLLTSSPLLWFFLSPMLILCSMFHVIFFSPRALLGSGEVGQGCGILFCSLLLYLWHLAHYLVHSSHAMKIIEWMNAKKRFLWLLYL